MRMYDKAGRSRWPLVIGIAVVVVAAVIFFVVRAQPSGTPVAGPPTVTVTPTPTPTADGGSTGSGDGEDDVAPTGCLGGLDRTADMVLSAQKAAPHTTYGAVEAATAFYRFLWQYPYPSGQDIKEVSSNSIARTGNDAWKDIAGSYAAAGNDPTRGVVTAGTPFHLSTTNGLWRVSEDSTTDRVTVEMAVGYVINSELSPTKVAGIGLVMVWQDGSWHVEGGTNIDQTKLAGGGNRYTAGC